MREWIRECSIKRLRGPVFGRAEADPRGHPGGEVNLPGAAGGTLESKGRMYEFVRIDVGLRT
jgi:hypothetical protein